MTALLPVYLYAIRGFVENLIITLAYRVLDVHYLFDYVTNNQIGFLGV